jgi:hypothetical protein
MDERSSPPRIAPRSSVYLFGRTPVQALTPPPFPPGPVVFRAGAPGRPRSVAASGSPTQLVERLRRVIRTLHYSRSTAATTCIRR